MKIKIIKYISLVVGVFILTIIYLSVVGLETEKFNKQIEEKIFQINNKLDVKLQKIKLTLDPINYKINVKTVGTKIIYKKKTLELEYIEAQISFISLIKNKFITTNLKLSTKSILLKDLIRFVRTISNKPELFFLEQGIKKGHGIVNIKINFDKNGKIKDDYEINGFLKNGDIRLLKNHNLENINFNFNIKKNNFNINDLSISANKISFFSNYVKVTQDKKNFLLEGQIQSKKSNLNNKLLKIINLNYKNLIFLNANFSSKNNFSFNIDDRYKIKNLVIDSEIQVNESELQLPDLFNNYFPEINDSIFIKDHKVKMKYNKNYFTAEGFGKIKLEKEFNKIEYTITNKEKNISLVSNIFLSDLKLKKQKFLEPFFFSLNETIDLKNQQVQIDYYKDNLSIKGSGKIKLEKKFDKIDFHISKKDNKLNFDTQLYLDKSSFNINFLNFKKNNELKTLLKVTGSYKKNNEVNFDEIKIFDKDNKIVLKKLLLDKKNKIIKVDKVNLDYFDIENKKNKFLLLRNKNNDYEIKGPLFNANKLIDSLLKSKIDNKSNIFKNNINLDINLREVFIDDKNVIKNLKGKLNIKNNKVTTANIFALFDKNEYLTFTISTNNNEKITTLFSSRAKPLVKRYKFIKGYEEGYLDFYSSKKSKISKSTLKIFNFKLQDLPVLTKLLTLASLQGIADILSGEGIRFNELEMNFNNKGSLMTIDELYAIGPAISLLMSGYVEQEKLVSLRGTLVPATTINKTISSIPILGKILVGSKVGEGVFGVSFKIKGPLRNLETTVNPIKSLTPRFITRTLENIKKN